MGLMWRQRRFFVTTASSFGLNPGSLKALLDLDIDNPSSMRSLAEAWHCDASNVTWLVDQLETRGLVRRQVSTLDRRVRPSCSRSMTSTSTRSCGCCARSARCSSAPSRSM